MQLLQPRRCPTWRTGVSTEPPFLWAAKLLFVPRLCILIFMYSAFQQGMWLKLTLLLCQRLWEKSLWHDGTTEWQREGERERKNPIKLSGAPEREDVKPRLFSFTLYLPLPRSLSSSVALLPRSSVWKGNDLGWGRRGGRTSSMRPTAEVVSMFEAGREDLYSRRTSLYL